MSSSSPPKRPSSVPIRLAVLASGSGTTLQNLLDLITASQLRAEVKLVIGSRPGLRALERAQAAGIRNIVVERSASDGCAHFSKQVFDLLRSAEVDLVCLAGWLCLLEIPKDFEGRIINIHPSLLPSFGGQGMYGKRVHEAVLAHGCKVSGCTVHFVDAAYDAGPIILQRTCPVAEDDTPQTLAARVFAEEKIAFPAAITLFAQGRLQVSGRHVHILPPPAYS